MNSKKNLNIFKHIHIQTDILTDRQTYRQTYVDHTAYEQTDILTHTDRLRKVKLFRTIYAW